MGPTYKYPGNSKVCPDPICPNFVSTCRPNLPRLFLCNCISYATWRNYNSLRASTRHNDIVIFSAGDKGLRPRSRSSFPMRLPGFPEPLNQIWLLFVTKSMDQMMRLLEFEQRVTSHFVSRRKNVTSQTGPGQGCHTAEKWSSWTILGAKRYIKDSTKIISCINDSRKGK